MAYYLQEDVQKEVRIKFDSGPEKEKKQRVRAECWYMFTEISVQLIILLL